MIIIGAGVVGAMTARALSRYELHVLLKERESVMSSYSVVDPADWSRPLRPSRTALRTCWSSTRAIELGGILLQSMRNGFGLEVFEGDLPGPMYAHRYIDEVLALVWEPRLDTTVVDVTPMRKVYVTRCGGFQRLEAWAVVLAMGSRERTRPQIRIPGTGPAGVYTAGLAQQFVNLEGWMPGERFVILGSGDIGMIMARRLTFEGAKVERVPEAIPCFKGLVRSYVQCLLDFDTPLKLQHTVNHTIGRDRVQAVEAIRLAEDWQVIPETEEILPCDTELICVTCPTGCELKVTHDGDTISDADGSAYNWGFDYVQEELTNPQRMMTTTVRVKGGLHPLPPVYTSATIPKAHIFDLLEELRKVEIEASVNLGETVLAKVVDTHVDVLASREMPAA